MIFVIAEKPSVARSIQKFWAQPLARTATGRIDDDCFVLILCYINPTIEHGETSCFGVSDRVPSRFFAGHNLIRYPSHPRHPVHLCPERGIRVNPQRQRYNSFCGSCTSRSPSALSVCWSYYPTWLVEQQVGFMRFPPHLNHKSIIIRGNLYDNAMAENFFSIPKTEYMYRHKPATFSEANEMIDHYLLLQLRAHSGGRRWCEASPLNSQYFLSQGAFVLPA